MKKKILAMTLVLTICVSIFSLGFTTNATSALWGDADGNGKVDLNDLSTLSKAANGSNITLGPKA